MNLSKIKGFFELGVAFAQFSAQLKQENYENTRKIALALELEFPNYDDLKGKLTLQLTINEASNSYKHACYLATIVLDEPLKPGEAYKITEEPAGHLTRFFHPRKDLPIAIVRSIYRQANWEWT